MTTQAMSAVPPAQLPSTQLKKDAVGVPALLFFVLSAQAPLTGVVGAAGLAVALGNGAGAPGAYLLVGLITVLFAVGFTTMARHTDIRGGFFAISRAGLGPVGGGIGALVAVTAYHLIQAAMYGLLAGTLASAVTRWTGIALPWWIYAVAAIAVVWILGLRGIELGARLLAVLVSAEVLILLVFAVFVLATGGGSHGGGFDLTASFSPQAVLSGMPAIAIMFAIASMFGFESTAIYAGETRDAQRTVPRATYLAVIGVSVFFAFIMFMLVSFYGAPHAQDAALGALAVDPAVFVLEPMDAVLGPWASAVTEVLLITSLLAGVLAFHNTGTRYLHAMSSRGMLPASLARTNARQTPSRAAAVQSAIAALLVVPFALGGLDPVLSLFSWFSGLAVAALVILYIVTSVAIMVFFARTRVEPSIWKAFVAPALTTVLMAGELVLLVANFTVLTGTDAAPGVAWALLAGLAVVVVVGAFLRSRPAPVGEPLL
ncbi:APC family permease [Microbacterium stercoris]|uniref:APC family permease n=1 Tax=Microbacterium stercoris TaxID=2820289 RepID=A0A939QL57_9MICO|nr:APC family permease [Microbacterium stercoris]MBO3664927.1 APC family permease [Microbacterium stercoris]